MLGTAWESGGWDFVLSLPRAQVLSLVRELLVFSSEEGRRTSSSPTGPVVRLSEPHDLEQVTRLSQAPFPHL